MLGGRLPTVENIRQLVESHSSLIESRFEVKLPAAGGQWVTVSHGEVVGVADTIANDDIIAPTDVSRSSMVAYVPAVRMKNVFDDVMTSIYFILLLPECSY